MIGRGAILLACGSYFGCSKRPVTSQFRFQQPWINDAEFLGYFVATARGYYKTEGLDISNVVGGPDIVPEVVVNRGDAQIALTSPDNTLSLVIKQQLPLRIIGAQYHSSPMGVLSLSKTGIRTPADLRGKKVAVPQVNTLMFEAFLRANGIEPKEVNQIVYNYDPSVVVDGAADATLDFVTNVKYTIEMLVKQRLAEAKAVLGTTNVAELSVNSFYLADNGYPLMMDTVVVTERQLRDNRDQVKAWLRASRKGWSDVFADVEGTTKQYMQPFLEKSGRKIDHEVSFSQQQKALIQNPKGIYYMTPESINRTIISLKAAGINATSSMFDNSVVAELT